MDNSSNNELTQVNEALNQSETHYRLISELISDFTYGVRIEPDGTLKREWAYGTDNIVGIALNCEGVITEWQSLIEPDDLPAALAHFNELISGRESQLEFRIIAAEGQRRWIRNHARVLTNPQTGQARLIYGAAQDITGQKQSEQRYQMLFNEMKEGFALHEMLYDSQGVPVDYRFLAINPAFERLTGLDAAQWIGKTVLQVLPDTEKSWIDAYGKVVLSGEPAVFESYSQELNRYYSVSAFRPAPNQFACIFTDVSERRVLEENLRVNEERLRLAMDATSDGMWDWDLTKDAVYWSPRAYEMLGYQPDEFPINSLVWKSLIHPDDLALAASQVEAQLVEKGEAFEIEYRCHTKTDGWKWVAVRGKPADWDEQGKVTRLVGTQVDIHERKLIQQALRESEQKYRLLVENLNEGIWVIDSQAVTTFVNPRMAQMLGYSADEMLGKHLFEFMDEQGVELCKENLARRQAGIQEQHDFEFRRKDSSRMYALLETSPIMDEQGNYQGSLAGIQDITDRRQMEVELKKSLEEKEILLKEIHHRVKNNLNLVSALLDLQSTLLEEQPVLSSAWVKQAFVESQQRIRTIARLHEKLYRSRLDGQVHAREYFEDILQQLSHAYAGKLQNLELQVDIADVQVDLDTAIPCALVINELVTNAFVHAFPNGESGSGANDDQQTQRVMVSLLPREGSLVLRVADNGVGIQPQAPSQPPVSLGINLVNMFTEQLGGTINVDVTNGTVITIEFPWAVVPKSRVENHP